MLTANCIKKEVEEQIYSVTEEDKTRHMLHQRLLKDGVHFHKVSIWSFKNKKQGTRVYQVFNI